MYGLKIYIYIYIEDTVICYNGSGMFCARSLDLLQGSTQTKMDAQNFLEVGSVWLEPR